MDGYYDSLLSLFDKAVQEGFLKSTGRSIVVSAPTPKELIDKMEVHLNIQRSRPRFGFETASTDVDLRGRRSSCAWSQ